MRSYFFKIPKILKYFYPKAVWHMGRGENNVYLTFDDGPVVGVTDRVLEILDRYSAKATFFCVGESIEKSPELFNEIQKRGHRIGNHTYSHIDGFKFSVNNYINDVVKADKLIKSDLFRPAYGRLTPSQYNVLKKERKIVMWDVMPGDFDESVSPEQCYENIINNVVAGSIVVFHDSDKALKNVEYALPKMLEYFSSKGYSFKTL